jgi:hypothetical protein
MSGMSNLSLFEVIEIPTFLFHRLIKRFKMKNTKKVPVKTVKTIL